MSEALLDDVEVCCLAAVAFVGVGLEVSWGGEDCCWFIA